MVLVKLFVQGNNNHIHNFIDICLLESKAKMLNHLRAGFMHVEEASPGCLWGGEGGGVVRDQEVALLTHLEEGGELYGEGGEGGKGGALHTMGRIK